MPKPPQIQPETDPILAPFKFTNGYELAVSDLGSSEHSSETCTKHKGILIQLIAPNIEDCASIILPPKERRRLVTWLRKFEKFDKKGD